MVGDIQVPDLNATSVQFNFAFRDWKYLSQSYSFSSIIKDQSVINGTNESWLDIHLARLVTLDEQTGSRYEVAGRMFFEATVFGEIHTSYVTNGFFDRNGYEQPLLSTQKQLEFLKILIPSFLGFASIFAFCLYKRSQRNKKIAEELEKFEAFKKKQKLKK